MSKPVTRIALAALISLAVIVGIFTSVQGAAPESAVGSHLVSGAKVNLDHFREANPAPAPIQSDFHSGKGLGGCEDEIRTSPDD